MRLREIDSFSMLLIVLGAVLAIAVILYAFGYNTREYPAYPERWVTGGEPVRGQEVIHEHGCGSCHSIPGIRDADGEVGPELTGLREKQFLAGQTPNTPENLVRWVMNPKHVEPGTAMPDLGLTEAEARDVAAYLYSVQ